MIRRDIPWQSLEKHETETKALFQELGFVDSKNQVRRFDGRIFYPRYAQLGHDAVDINACMCVAVGDRLCGEWEEARKRRKA